MLNPAVNQLTDFTFDLVRNLFDGLKPPDGLEPLVLSIGEPQHPVPPMVAEILAEKHTVAEGGKTAKSVFELMAFFAGYGFNKSHSAAYALVAYHTAWLKAHYPVHFMAALLTTEKGNTDKLVKYINECREMGIEILPPDINTSALDFSVDGGKIRFGLSAIKNVGRSAVRSMVAARREHGSFEDIFDLTSRVDLRLVNRRVMESLVAAGALDGLHGHRAQQYQAIGAALDLSESRVSQMHSAILDRLRGQLYTRQGELVAQAE